MDNSTNILFRLPIKLRTDFKNIALAKNRTMSKQIRELIIQFVDRENNHAKNMPRPPRFISRIHQGEQ